MSYTSLLTDINTALAAAGLTPHADPRDSSLTQSGRGNFDGAYLIINETGSQPWAELALSPNHWRARLRLEVATALTTSAETQSITVETRARAVFEALVYATTPLSRRLYEWQEPQLQRVTQDKRLVWIVRFSARWTE